MKEKVLVIRNSALGDVAMTLPVLYSVASQYPDTDFYLLTRPFFAKIFVNAPKNLHIIEADFKNSHKGIKGLAKLIKTLYKYNFSAVADLHNVLRSWIIDASMRLKGKRVEMVDKKRSDRNIESLRHGQESFISRYTDVFRRLGYPVELSFNSIFDGERPSTSINIRQPAIGIAPFSRYTNKTYPIDKMKKVVEILCAQGVNVYLFGAKGEEADILDLWQGEIKGCTSLAGKMDIVSELSAMSQMNAIISMDSANQHLASVTGTKVISIWGATTPGCGFYGYRQNPDNAICMGLDCQPCTVAGSEKCHKGDLACMNRISPEQIVQKALNMIYG